MNAVTTELRTFPSAASAFSDTEYARRYALVGKLMRDHELAAILCYGARGGGDVHYLANWTPSSEAYLLLVHTTRPGMTELDLGRIVDEAQCAEGGYTTLRHIISTPMASPAAGVPAKYLTSRVLARGDVFVVELSAGWGGYTSHGWPPGMTFEQDMAVVLQPNVVTRDGRAGVQYGQMLRVTADGASDLHHAPGGLLNAGGGAR